MKITFQNPPVTGSNDPFLDFQPNNPNHYPKGPGIYIYGLRLNISINNGFSKVFAPIAVGETTDLKKRLLNEHYNSLITNGNNKKELFSWDIANNVSSLIDIYTDMQNYKQSNVCHNATLNSLIWYNHPDFFNIRLRLCKPTDSNYISGSGQLKSIKMNGDLDLIDSNNKGYSKAHELKHQILKTKELFVNNFYFIFFNDNSIEDNMANISCKNIEDRHSLEKTIKVNFNKIGIYTTADSRRGSIMPMRIDLTNLENTLINLGKHSYGMPYVSPLIL